MQIEMKKADLAKRLAKQVGVSRAEAADQLDHVVSQIISNLKKGEIAQLPGLGKFKPGPKWAFSFERRGGGKEPGRRGKR
jgi:nucleoid DNA-binding protein